MPEQLAWYDDDDVTPISAIAVGVIQPGEDYITRNGNAKQFILKNTGDVPFASASVEIQQVGGGNAWTRVEIATAGSEPTYPTGYVDKDGDPLAVGAMAAPSQINIWLQITEPPGAAAAQGKAFNLAAVGVV